TTGSLMISAFECPAGMNTAPANAVAECTDAAGSQTLTLTGPGGTDVTTSGNGVATVNGLAPGTYSLAGSTVCAVQTDLGDDASSFTVAAGQTTQVRVFNCIPSDGTGGQTGGGTSGPGNGDGTGGNGSPIGNPGGAPGSGDGTDPN